MGSDMILVWLGFGNLEVWAGFAERGGLLDFGKILVLLGEGA